MSEDTDTTSSVVETPPVAASDVTPPPAVEPPAAPVSPFVPVPSNVRILFHLPPQRRGLTSRINSVFFFTNEFGRIDGSGRLLPNDGGMHVYESRLLTLEEYMQPKVQKWLAADDLVVRPLVRVLALPEGSLPPSAPVVETGPSLEEVKAMIDQIDLLRSQLQAAQEKAEELESHNRTLGSALDKIEASQKVPDVVPAVNPHDEPATDATPPATPPKRSHKKN